MKRFSQFPSFHTKSQELEIHNEKNFKESQKKKVSQVEVLASYFSIKGDNREK
jgi:hypothetical protein